jgi:hypothetical protein
MKPIAAFIWAVCATVILAAPPLLWQPWRAQLDAAIYAFVASFITAVITWPGPRRCP